MPGILGMLGKLNLSDLQLQVTVFQLKVSRLETKLNALMDAQGLTDQRLAIDGQYEKMIRDAIDRHKAESK